MTFTERIYRILILEERYKLILGGLKNTLIISFFASLVGCLIGGLICFFRVHKNKFFNNIAKVYIYLFRGIPIVLLLMLMYYIILNNSGMSGVGVSILTFSLYHGAYVAEIFRSGLLSVKSEQIEASTAIGFTKVQSLKYIILPQVIRIIFPVYKGEFITLVKLTSIVGYIGVRDLTRAIDIVRSQTFDALYPLVLATILYFILIGGITLILNLLEKLKNPRKA